MTNKTILRSSSIFLVIIINITILYSFTTGILGFLLFPALYFSIILADYIFKNTRDLNS